LIAPGCSRDLKGSVDQAHKRLVLKSVYDLGVVEHGREVRGTIEVQNLTDRSMTIRRLTSGCDCLKWIDSGRKLTIPANETAYVSIEYNPEAEPEFHGSLLIPIEAFDENDRVIFSTSVSVKVK
jgi:hypothetical protein